MLWPPEQPVQVLLAPTLNVLTEQFSSALLSVFGFFPAEAVLQKALPASENWPGPSQGVQPTELDAPFSLKVPAGQFSSAVSTSLQYCPGGVDTHELAPTPLWPPEQPVQVLLAPTLKVSAGQFSSALLAVFGFFPAPAVLQKALPAVEN